MKCAFCSILIFNTTAGSLFHYLSQIDSFCYNNYGPWLIGLCLSSKIYILNGRCNGYLLGSFTSNQYEGSNVVDYNIISKKILHRVRTFREKGLTDYSDHWPRTLSLP